MAVRTSPERSPCGGLWRAGVLLLLTLLGRFPYLEKLFADSAYQGPIFADALAKMLSRVKIEIVKRSDQAKGFVTLPKRWIVERTIAWLNRCRRLAKDWENLNVTALMFLRSPPSASCCEGSAIPHKLSSQTLSKGFSDEGAREERTEGGVS